MKLNSNFTEASVCTALVFSEKETADALREYASSHGYKFDEAVGQTTRVGTHRNIDRNNVFQLVINAQGTSEPLIQEDK